MKKIVLLSCFVAFGFTSCKCKQKTEPTEEVTVALASRFTSKPLHAQDGV